MSQSERKRMKHEDPVTLDSLDKRLIDLAEDVEDQRERFDRIDERFDRIDERFDRIEAKLDKALSTGQ